ncbi:MAG: NADH-quinone oxidoreductase subunit C [Nitrospirae bacterium]|nr:MAG: NADH-quinone oxidoreductase subunit C [Nitrospirota bacterium]
MEPLEIASLLKEKFPEEVREIKEFRGQVSVTVKRDRILEIMRFLKETPELDFDLLKDLCGVDYLGKKDVRFEVVYTLYSLKHKHMIRIKAEVPESDCEIDSVVPIWRGADWHEREAYDLFGIAFRGHPDLRRILLPENWEGHPLRKDYPVAGPEPEADWKGFREVVSLHKQLEKYQWKGQ